MRFIRGNKKGFSLVELLVVTAMLGVVSLAIYSTFNNGLKIWNKINQPLAEEELGMFFERLSQDLGNCFRSVTIPFSGSINNLTIPTLVDNRQLNFRSLGQVTYLCNPQSGLLWRQQKNFSQIYSKTEDEAAVLLKNVKFFKFEYYYWDAIRKQYLWKEEWSGAGVPLSVRVSLSLDEPSQSDKITRTINIHPGR